MLLLHVHVQRWSHSHAQPHVPGKRRGNPRPRDQILNGLGKHWHSGPSCHSKCIHDALYVSERHLQKDQAVLLEEEIEEIT